MRSIRNRFVFRRLAEVWLDEYKKFFYEISPNARNLDMGSIEKQLANKKRLNCKPFKYFITDVVKDMYPPTLLSYTEGGLSPTKDPRLCLDTYGKERGRIRLYGCHHKVRWYAAYRHSVVFHWNSKKNSKKISVIAKSRSFTVPKTQRG